MEIGEDNCTKSGQITDVPHVPALNNRFVFGNNDHHT